MLDKKQLSDIISSIKIKPKKIILFGSYATGNQNENSDLDLLIIKEKISNKRMELISLKSDIISKDISIDILLYTEEEYIKKLNEGWQLFEDIKNNGVIIDD